jgi:hypothetical protein
VASSTCDPDFWCESVGIWELWRICLNAEANSVGYGLKFTSKIGS